MPEFAWWCEVCELVWPSPARYKVDPPPSCPRCDQPLLSEQHGFVQVPWGEAERYYPHLIGPAANDGSLCRPERTHHA